jgi:hypothetical protein
MEFDLQLQLLLKHEMPRMTAEGEAQFRSLMEKAIEGVVRQAFEQDILDAFRVTKMTA